MQDVRLGAEVRQQTMAPVVNADPKIFRHSCLEILMDSPLYWLMSVRERLALIRQLGSGGKPGGGVFRQKALSWVRDGIWAKEAVRRAARL